MMRTVSQQEVVVIAPQDSELMNCESYRATVGKERIAYIEQTKNITKCNNRWEAIREWKAKQLELYKPQDKKK